MYVALGGIKMREFSIISDGSCDLSEEDVLALGVQVVPFYVSFENEKYLKEKEEIGIRDFYQKLVDNPSIFPKSSMPTAEDYLAVFEKTYPNKILCITITKKFSGSLNSALLAKNMYLEKHPDAIIEVVDSTVNTVLQGLFVREVVRMRDSGLSLEQTLIHIDKIKDTGRIYFTVNGLSYLKNGGRIGKVSAVIGNILKINPLIILKNGEIQSGGIALSRKRAILKTLDKLKDYFQKYNENMDDYIISIGYGYSKEEAEEYRKKVEEILKRPVDCFDQIGATIAVHTGPYPLGLAFIKKFDV